MILIKNDLFFIEKRCFPGYFSRIRKKQEESMNGNDMIEIPARNVKVADSADICIVGGNCTGVFAAVRRGTKVMLMEQ